MHQQHPAEKRCLLGKLCPGERKLDGKTFYLDNVKKRQTVLLLEAISLLGGKIEGFLHKNVNFFVTGNPEGLKEERNTDAEGGGKEANYESQRANKQRESVLSSEKRPPRPATPRPAACGSRGKALLEKAIRNNERLQGSSVLASARSLGVKILYVDDVLLYLKQLTRESFSVKQKRPERTYTKQQGPHVKAAALRSPYLKIEDLSRKYRPLLMQALTFPSLCYLGRYSPFESPPPPRFEKRTEEEEASKREKKSVDGSFQDKSQTPLIRNPSPWRARKKDTSYCECCHQPFTNLDEHLQSDQHRAFVLDQSNYCVIDDLVAEMIPGFNPSPVEHKEEMLNRPPSLVPIQDVCELEPLTDDETERAVQALRRQSSSLITPTVRLDPNGPAGQLPEVPCPISTLATLPTEIKPVTPTLNFPAIQLAHIQPRSLSPTMPVLDIERHAHTTVCQLSTRCASPDPYSLPPVLSPQVPWSSHSADLDGGAGLYLEPPVLSPQHFTAEETVEGVDCEMDTADNLSKSVSAASLLSSVAVTSEEVKGSDQDGVFVLCSTSRVEPDKMSSHRSRSLPRQSATSPNPKKRHRSASSDSVHCKRRRVGVNFEQCTWTKQDLKGMNPESDLMAKVVGCLVFDPASQETTPCPLQRKASSTCTADTLNLQQGVTLSCLPTEQTKDISHMIAPTKTLTFHPPLQPPSERCLQKHASSQDSQRSLSTSTSVCIDSALIPDISALSPSSSESDWDCDLLSRLDTAPATLLPHAEQGCELDKDLLHQPCTWLHDSSYESRLHTALQPSNPLCGEDMDPSVFSRTVVQIVEVQH